MNYPALKESNISGLGAPRRGKVRDIYDLGDNLCIVTTDRISTHDVVYEQCIPNKGFALTQTAVKAFELLNEKGIPSHMIISPDPNTMIVWKVKVYPVEAVVRGILTGGGWKSYERTGEVCGVKLPRGLKKNCMLDEPIFTPTTKAETGHDEPVTFERLLDVIGPVAHEIRRLSIEAYKIGLEQARENGGILADTKFEYGSKDGDLVLADEALTHDSSRWVDIRDWEQAFQEVRDPHWLDKQVVRDYAESVGFTGQGEAPHLPDEIIRADISALGGAYLFLTGHELGDPPKPPTNERIARNLIKAGWIEWLC